MKNIKFLIATFSITLITFFIGFSMVLGSSIEIKNYVDSQNANKINIVICKNPSSYNPDQLKSKDIFYLDNIMQLFNQGWPSLNQLNIYKVDEKQALSLVHVQAMNSLKAGTMLMQFISPIMMLATLAWNYKKVSKFLNKNLNNKKKNINMVRAKPKIITPLEVKKNIKPIINNIYQKIYKPDIKNTDDRLSNKKPPKITNKIPIKNFYNQGRTIGKLDSKATNNQTSLITETRKKPNIKFERTPRIEIQAAKQKPIKETIIDPNDILRKDLSSHNPGDYITYKGLQYKLIKIEPATYKGNNVWKATSKNLKNNNITIIYFTK